MYMTYRDDITTMSMPQSEIGTFCTLLDKKLYKNFLVLCFVMSPRNWNPRIPNVLPDV